LEILINAARKKRKNHNTSNKAHPHVQNKNQSKTQQQLPANLSVSPVCKTFFVF